MRKFAAIFLAVVMLITLAMPVFANGELIAGVESDCTVIWSEVLEDGKQFLVIALDEKTPSYLTLDPNGRIALKSDGSDEGNKLLNAVKNSERIQAGSVITLYWSGNTEDSYPIGLGGITTVTFTEKETMMALSDAQKIFDELNELNESEKFKFIDYESTRFKVRSLCTVVGCRYDEEHEFYEMALSFRRSIYATYDNLYRWYYTTSNEGFYLNDKEDALITSDGSERGDYALSLALKGEPVPLGTMVEILWSGMVLESFPPNLEGIVSYTFTGMYTDYSYDDIISQLNSMNDMRTNDAIKYPVPDESEVNNCYYRREFTVLESTPAKEPDYAEYGIYTPSLILVRKYGSGQYTDLVSVGVNANKHCVTRDNDLAAKEIYEQYISNHEIPQGTVVEVVWQGTTEESYPGGLVGVVEINFTSKASEFTAEELAELQYEYDHAFDDIMVENPDNEMQSSSSSGDYPAMIMHDNTVYELVGETAGDVSEDAIIGYTTSYTDGTPHREGETNFSRETGLPYANVEFNGERGIAVHYNGAWNFFKPVYDMAPPPPSENPNTGTADIFAGIALAGVLSCAVAMVSRIKER